MFSPCSVEIVDQPGVDIFGQVYNQWKNKECVCPNCNRSIAASRFAPHLEKCLGMGRNSSRIANRRSARGTGHGQWTLQCNIENKPIHSSSEWAILIIFLVLVYRIASSNNMNNKSESDQEDNDDVNDNDWSYGSEKKGENKTSVNPCLNVFW